jgi:hypothetical protein
LHSIMGWRWLVALKERAHCLTASNFSIVLRGGTS